MITFNTFRLLEDDSEATKVQELRLQLSQNFDELTDAKALKKEGDPASESASLDKQSAIYVQISNTMKALSAEIKKQQTTVATPTTT
jgi:hypothetical protein